MDNKDGILSGGAWGGKSGVVGAWLDVIFAGVRPFLVVLQDCCSDVGGVRPSDWNKLSQPPASPAIRDELDDPIFGTLDGPCIPILGCGKIVLPCPADELEEEPSVPAIEELEEPSVPAIEELEEPSVPAIEELEEPSVPAIEELEEPSVPAIEELEEPSVPAIEELDEPSVPAIEELEEPSVPAIEELEEPRVLAIEELDEPSVSAIEELEEDPCDVAPIITRPLVGAVLHL